MSDVWNRASANVSNRDKVLRVFQYSSVMLLAFYKDDMSSDSVQMYQNIRSSASTARRGFRLLKSLNHFANIFNILKHSTFNTSQNYLESGLSIANETAMASLYFYDNIFFLSRLGLFSHTVQEQNTFHKKSLISWFLAECIKLTSIMFKHKTHLHKLSALRAKKKQMRSRSPVRSFAHNYKILKNEIACLEGQSADIHFQYMKAVCNITLSASLVDDRMFVHVMGRRAYDVTTGVLGALTAAFSLYENNFHK